MVPRHGRRAGSKPEAARPAVRLHAPRARRLRPGRGTHPPLRRVLPAHPDRGPEHRRGARRPARAVPAGGLVPGGRRPGPGGDAAVLADRDVQRRPGDRVPHPQRLLHPPAEPAAVVLPGAPDGRPDVACGERHQQHPPVPGDGPPEPAPDAGAVPRRPGRHAAGGRGADPVGRWPPSRSSCSSRATTAASCSRPIWRGRSSSARSRRWCRRTPRAPWWSSPTTWRTWSGTASRSRTRSCSAG